MKKRGKSRKKELRVFCSHSLPIYPTVILSLSPSLPRSFPLYFQVPSALVVIMLERQVTITLQTSNSPLEMMCSEGSSFSDNMWLQMCVCVCMFGFSSALPQSLFICWVVSVVIQRHQSWWIINWNCTTRSSRIMNSSPWISEGERSSSILNGGAAQFDLSYI